MAKFQRGETALNLRCAWPRMHRGQSKGGDEVRASVGVVTRRERYKSTRDRRRRKEKTRSNDEVERGRQEKATNVAQPRPFKGGDEESAQTCRNASPKRKEGNG